MADDLLETALESADVEPALGSDDATVDGEELPPEPEGPPDPEDPRVGRYRLLDRLGVGGMGTVFLAEDPELERLVAIKLLHARSARGDSQTRLLREAQAMARVSHPHVAAVYDVGKFGDETFVAMEYLAGGTLEQWLAEGPRSQDEILRVFVAAGRGLEAAHAAELIHRDFKPANVLLSLDGVPKVTDFGLVRASQSALDSAAELSVVDASASASAPRPLADSGPHPLADSAPHPADSSPLGSPSASSSGVGLGTASTLKVGRALALQLTRVGAAMGTPAYMAPEQLGGQGLDARTDQFSFCVALSEALWGEPPFAGDDIAARVRAVIANERRPRDPELPRAVPPWLDAILERGLSPEPDDRWPSMSALLAAIEDNPTLRRRRRRRGLVTASLGLGLAVALSLGLWTQGQVQARSCTHKANASTLIWRDHQGDLYGALEAGGPRYAAAHSERVMAAVENWRRRWGRAREGLCLASAAARRTASSQAAVRCLDGQLDAFAAFLEVFGESAERPGVAAHALSAIDALPDPDTCTEPGAAQLDASACSGELHRQLHHLRALELAGLYQDGAREGARLLADPSLPGCPALRDEATAYVGELELELNQIDAAREHLLEALRSAGRRDDLPTSFRASQGLAAIARIREESEASQVWLELAAVFVARQGSPPELEVELYLDRAQTHFARSELEACATELDGARALITNFLGEQHPAHLRWLARHARLIDLRGDSRAAVAELEAAVALAEDIYGPEHPMVVELMFALGGSLDSLDAERSLSVSNAALDIAEHIYPADHLELAQARNTVAVALIKTGDTEGGRAELEALLAQLDAMAEPDMSMLGNVLSNLGAVLRRQDDYPAAERHLRRAVATIEETLGPEHHRLGLALLNLGNVIGRLGQLEESITVQTRALEIFDLMDREHPWVALVLGNIGSLQLDAGRPREALASFERAVAVTRVALGEDNPRYPEKLVDLARTEAALGQRERAAEHFDKALAACAAQVDAAQELADLAEGDGTSLKDEACAEALGHLTLFHLQGGPAEATRTVEIGARAYAVAAAVDDPVARAEQIFAYAQALAATDQDERALELTLEALAALALAPTEWRDVEGVRLRLGAALETLNSANHEQGR